MKHPDVIRLEELIGKHPGARPRLLSSDATSAPGQIWAIAGATAQHRFGEVILLSRTLDETGLALVDVAPLIHDATLAGPMDYILPESVLCHHAAVLLSLSFSLPQGKLGECLGAVDEVLYRELLAHYGKSHSNELSPNELHAPDYFDTYDIRYRFHEEVARQITGLQAELYRWLGEFESEDEGRKGVVIHAENRFYVPALMAAAGGGEPERRKPFRAIFKLDGRPLELIIRRSRKAGYFFAVVLRGDKDGRCAKVLTNAGRELAAIVHGESKMPFEWTSDIGNNLIIADIYGQPLVTIKVK